MCRQYTTLESIMENKQLQIRYYLLKHQAKRHSSLRFLYIITWPVKNNFTVYNISDS